MIEEDDQSGFGERPMVEFAHSLDSRVAFYRFAFTIYNYRCAISGLRFESQGGALHDRLEVVPIHPRELDGPLEITNVLVLESGLAAAFANGAISAGDDYQIMVLRPDVLTEAQRSLIEPGRTMFLPDDPLFRPAKKHLHFHRMVIAKYPE